MYYLSTQAQIAAELLKLAFALICSDGKEDPVC